MYLLVIGGWGTIMTDKASPQYAERSFGHANRPLNIENCLCLVLAEVADKATNVSSIADQISKFLSVRGIDTFSYILLSENHKRLTRPKRMMTTLPYALVRAYDEKNYGEKDIMLQYALHARRNVLYSTLLHSLKHKSGDGYSETTTREISLLYQAFGYHDFYLIPISRNGYTALFSLARRGSDTSTLISRILVN